MENAFLNMKSVLSAISKALTKAASQILFIQDPIAAVVASEAIDLGADMLKGCSLLERDDIHKKIHVWCKNIIPSKNEEYYEVICAATEICLEDLNLFDEGFNVADVAKRLSTRYIQRYQAQFSDADISCLEYALPAVLGNH